MLLYTSAPLLGRWSDCVRFGSLLRSKYPDCDAMHQSSSMDYAELWRMSHEQQKHGDAPSSELLWRDYTIVSQRIRLVAAECANPSILAELEAQFAGDDTTAEAEADANANADSSCGSVVRSRPWQPLDVLESSELVRCGALAQCKSFSPAGIPLVGPADRQSIWVQGAFDMSDGRSVQHETWRLSRAHSADSHSHSSSDAAAASCVSACERWLGSYTLVQRERESSASACLSPSLVPPLATLTCTFDLELTLQPRHTHTHRDHEHDEQTQQQQHAQQQSPSHDDDHQ